ncbi:MULTISPECIES: caspase domain-containing protein [unclassified Bradyrhizobium]|uniref:caspase family protein n=1 Tax=unclassified Bradyrhizobium TaxID=2631580 RepID=UPI002916FF51|nr:MULTISPECIES: caspase family protein [unclassified Bradyrhizobium]
MKRRDLLVGGGLALAQFAASKGLAQCSAPSARAAVVVGVNKTGALPVLRAAVSGAKAVAAWLCSEGFEVKLIVDETGPVTADSVKRAVFELVDRGTLTHLVVYFSGHGVCVGFNEYWLLTGAPRDASEAVTLMESWELAHRSGIPNVVFISDACRSIPEYQTSLLTGTLIFPIATAPGTGGKVDRFLATEPGQSSIEASAAAAAYDSIFTSAFLDAYKHPRQDMVRQIDGQSVVPNYLLEDYLRKEVPLRLARIDLKHRQVPEARIESRDNFYIGRALQTATADAGTPIAPENIRIFDVANREFARSSLGTLGPLRDIYASALKQVADETGFTDAKISISQAKSTLAFDAETGFAINGATVRHARSTGRTVIDIMADRVAPALVRVTPADRRPAAVALMFEDGSGTVLAALPGFIGTITVEGGRVTSLTYEPSVRGGRPAASGDQKTQLDELHALVGAAAKYGAFRIEGSEQERARSAERLASQVRVMKGIDPTLGIYAAYAYADANLVDQVRSVQSFMKEDLGSNLFDVALLANRLTGTRAGDPNDPVPFCPMLTQGWQLLRVKEVALPEAISQARYHLREALWTTFDPQGMKLVLNYMT